MIFAIICDISMSSRGDGLSIQCQHTLSPSELLDVSKDKPCINPSDQHHGSYGFCLLQTKNIASVMQHFAAYWTNAIECNNFVGT